MSLANSPASLQPQNPYSSFMVAASAGSGKTYQLSQRFLALVGAGAAPGAILTVTFTKKAAAEMRSRILEEAAHLAADPRKQAAFTEQMRRFYATPAARGSRAPLPAEEVAQRVLAASQLLKISTIDSLFLEWVSKFPFEASAAVDDSSAPLLPSPFQLLGPHEQRTLHRRAWRSTCQLLARARRRGDSELQPLLDLLSRQGLSALEERLLALDQQETYLWYAEARRGEGFIPHPTALVSDADLLDAIGEPMQQIAATLADAGRRDRLLSLLGGRCVPAILATELLTRADYRISGSYIRGKKREALVEQIQAVEAAVHAYVNGQRLTQLSVDGYGYYRLHRMYRQLRDQLKWQAGQLEFRDLVKGSYRLLHGAASAGVRFLLARTVQHVMLDEFQDTSRLQWAIFEELISQMLAGEERDEASTLAPSVFIVGDAKQSIYGFREAEATVLATATASLDGRVTQAPLNRSYRTAQVVLDFVNAVFAPGLAGAFPRHETALLGEAPAVADIGRVLVLDLIKAVKPAGTAQLSVADTGDEGDEGETDQDGAEAEAEQLAQLLKVALSGQLDCPVIDKASGGVRPLRAGDCCILYRSTTKSATFAAALRRHGIACQREEERGFFSRSEVQDLCALLRYLALPSDSVALATVLRSPLGGISDEQMLGLFAGEPADGDRSALVLAAVKKVQPQLGGALEQLLAATDQVLPHALLLQCFARLNAFTAMQRRGAEAAEAMLVRRNLLRLVELVMRLEDQGLTSLAPLIARLGELAADDEIGNAAAPADAVTLMTIHKAKGLEFPCVLLVDTGRPWGKRDLYWSQGDDAAGQAGLYYTGKRDEQPLSDTAFARLLAMSDEATTEECQRLLYVALTRARQYLVISGHEVTSRQGLTATKVYDQLARATTALARGFSPLQLAGLRGSACASMPAELLATARPPAPPPEVAPLVWRAAPGLPRELAVTSPSRHEASFAVPALVVEAKLSPPLAAAVGTFIHKGLEALMRDRPFAHAEAWRQATVGLLPPPGLEAATVREVADLASEPTLLALKGNARRLETELPLVHYKGHSLVVGALDLLVEDGNGQLTIIDYKTTRFAGTAASLAMIPDGVLRSFCHQRGYVEQLSDYTAAVRALYPGASVSAAVYFTALRRLLPLSQSSANSLLSAGPSVGQ